MSLNNRVATVAVAVLEEAVDGVGIGRSRAIRQEATANIGIRRVLWHLDLTACFAQNFLRDCVSQNLALELVNTPRGKGESMHRHDVCLSMEMVNVCQS